MKNQKTIDVAVCDFCGENDDCYSHCEDCKKDVCYDCEKTRGVEYAHSVYCTGSGDGWYCSACDAISKTKKHTAYMSIRSLILESRAFYDDFRKRSDAADAALKKLQ